MSESAPYVLGAAGFVRLYSVRLARKHAVGQDLETDPDQDGSLEDIDEFQLNKEAGRNHLPGLGIRPPSH